jgi:hypothetical protein
VTRHGHCDRLQRCYDEMAVLTRCYLSPYANHATFAERKATFLGGMTFQGGNRANAEGNVNTEV